MCVFPLFIYIIYENIELYCIFFYPYTYIYVLNMLYSINLDNKYKKHLPSLYFLFKLVMIIFIQKKNYITSKQKTNLWNSLI